MSTLAFTITGEPKGQPRPRAFARKMGNVHVARFYDSDVADEWKWTVRRALFETLQQTRWELTLAPVSVSITFAMPRPKSHSGAKGLKPSAPVAHVGKPDVDNLAKLILDQITRSECVWRDDSQVVSLRVEKIWASGNESGCSVLIALENKT
jgi:Holliday junction resolvase RusA-like endonuclease